MDHLWKLIRLGAFALGVLIAFALSGAFSQAKATILPTSSTTYTCTISSGTATGNTPEAACLTRAHTVWDTAGITNLSVTGCGSGSCQVSGTNSYGNPFGPATISYTTDSGASICPANSTLAGSACICNSGWNEIGGSCQQMENQQSFDTKEIPVGWVDTGGSNSLFPGAYTTLGSYSEPTVVCINGIRWSATTASGLWGVGATATNGHYQLTYTANYGSSGISCSGNNPSAGTAPAASGSGGSGGSTGENPYNPNCTTGTLGGPAPGYSGCFDGNSGTGGTDIPWCGPNLSCTTGQCAPGTHFQNHACLDVVGNCVSDLWPVSNQIVVQCTAGTSGCLPTTVQVDACNRPIGSGINHGVSSFNSMTERTTFQGNCGEAFTCTGDPAMCEIAKATKATACVFSGSGTTTFTVTGQNAMDHTYGANGADHPGNPDKKTTIDFSTGFNKTNPYSSGCPGDHVIQLGGNLGQMTIPLSSYCGIFEMMGSILVAFTSLACALWVIRV
jgi:hypothetical protein